MDTAFSAESGLFRAGAAVSSGDGSGETRPLKPPASWRAALLDPQLPEMFLVLASPVFPNDELRQQARSALVSLAGMEGEGTPHKHTHKHKDTHALADLDTLLLAVVGRGGRRV